MQAFEDRVGSLMRDLPDQQGPRLFLERIQKEHPRAWQSLLREPGLLSDVLTLTAWSPLLATTLEQNPEYIAWLMRERVNPRVRTCDELKESLARFALTHSSVTPQVLMARFRRRELLRIYLHDIRRTHTLVETTEELSNLADAILDYALSLARQVLENKYGSPRRTDDRGRIGAAEFCIVALGKLGSWELNYASDIDLIFIYSDDGTTSPTGQRGTVTNREYFIKLSENVAKLVGDPSGEGAAYRVDLRLRPHGRDGSLACSLNEAVRYYRETAQGWELQTLIRSRSAAGSSSLFASFFNAVRTKVYRAEVSVREALASVRLAKQKIDRHIEHRGGFNVKLSRGGIREIEFIAQALQLAHGGNDDWLRVSHTLISLGRLADRRLISEEERTELSDAYVFLRMLEHRLQMEHGLQTHTVPANPEQRALVARRLNFPSPAALEQFERTLKWHTSRVSKAYERIFASDAEEVSGPEDSVDGERHLHPISAEPVESGLAAAKAAATVFASHIELRDGEVPLQIDPLTRLICKTAQGSLNSHRALTNTARIAASLEKSDEKISISQRNLDSLIQLCGSSEFFAEMVASNPSLITCLDADHSKALRRDYRSFLRASVNPANEFSTALSALRRTWARLLLDIGFRDALGEIPVSESNRLQTELAGASISVALSLARREIIKRFGRLQNEPRIAILGLGRLASGGLDYGSDLDMIIVYDSLLPSPISSFTQEEAYARLAELMIAALGSVTREGYLYRIDLRLRPDGKNGPLVVSSQAFLDYLKERTVPWEWLAYAKLRAVGGDLDLARMIEIHGRHAIHQLAQNITHEELRTETRHVRDRLEKEKGQRGRHAGIDVKFPAGGMLDVYFATRYLQLRDDVSDEGEDRSTAATLERLHAAGSLNLEDFAALSSGYALLRSIDHQLRLILGRQARLPAIDHPAAGDLARRLGFASPADLDETVVEKMRGIREAYDRITRRNASL
jgi:[glutamine synthetase] adenylyltransferase / [glutamine synthetase]-adenylyl-L-tyrosine phosphorylase